MAVTIDAVGTLAASTDTGPVTPAYPSGMATGQLAVAIVGARDNHTSIVCNTAGWLPAGPQPQDSPLLQVRMSVWVAPYTAGDPAPEFVGVDGGGGNPANGIYAVLCRASGHDPSTPLDVAGAGAAGDSQTMTGAGLTTVTPGALVGVAYISSNDVAHATPGNSGALRTNQLTTVGSQCAVSLVTATRAAAGATGTYSLVQATSTRYQWAAVTFALRPAGTGTAHTRTIVDPIGVTDTAARSSTSARDVVDAVGLGDVVDRAAAAARPVVDAIGASDSLSYTNGTVHSREIVDAIGVTDSVARTVAAARPVVDAIGVTDELARTAAAARAVIDPIGLTDSRQISAGAGDPGVPLLPTALGAGGRLLVEAAFGADLTADPAGWDWVDITSDVRQSPGISYSKGRGEEAAASQPATCTMTLTNTSGAYSLGPGSAFYPNVRRGTPVRVRVAGMDGVLRVGFEGGAVGWSPGWDLTGRIRTVALEAAGTLRRLLQGASPLISPMRRAGLSRTDLVAYWPCEEGAAATTITPAVGGEGMTIAGFPDFAASSAFRSSLPVPTLKLSAWTGNVAPYAASGAVQVRALVEFPTTAQADGVLLRVFTTGSAARWDLIYESASGGLISGTVYDRFGNVLGDTNGIGFALNSPPLGRRWSLEMVQVAGDVTWRFSTLSASDGGAGYWVGPTLTGHTLGAVAAVVVNPDRVLDDVAVGHITVGTAQTDIYDDSEEFRAYAGEYCTGFAGRVARLTLENGVRLELLGTVEAPSPDTGRLGPQPIATLVELLRECETADQGTLYDGTGPGLVLRTRRNRENAAAVLTIDAGALELSPPFGPVDDDQRTRNRVEARQTGGSTVVVEDVDGPLGTAAIGVYEDSITVNTFDPRALPLFGGWLIARASFDGYRYPTITINLRATPQHAATWLQLQPGQRIDITDVDQVLPGHPGGVLSLMVEGTADTISADGWTGTARCSPYEPWRIATAAADAGDVGEYLGRADGDGSTLAAAVPGNTTSISVATAVGPLWTTTANDYPLDLEVGGRQVTATACSDPTTPQTMTIAPVPFELTAGSPVRLWRPTRTAL